MLDHKLSGGTLGQTKYVSVIAIAAATSIALYGIYTGICYNKRLHRRKGVRALHEMPSPYISLPYFGHIFQCSRELPGLKFHEWHRKYGPMFRVKMGVKDWVIIGDPIIAKEIFALNSAITSGRPFHTFATEHYAMNQRGMTFTNTSKRWKQSRAVARSILSFKALGRFTEHIEHEVAQMTSNLIKSTGVMGKVDIIQPVQLITLNVFMKTCFGKQVTSLDDPLFQAIAHSVDTTLLLGAPVNDLGTFLPALRGLFEFLMPIEKPMMEFIQNERNPLFRYLIREALESDSPCFVKDLYDHKQEYNFDADDILVFIADVINAGADVTAMTLSWILVILCNHKSLQQKIQQELDTFIAEHKRLPVFGERDRFPVLIAAQKECIRFRPTNHIGLPHETTDDLVYGGYLIPKGTTLVGNTYTMNLSTNEYQSPDEFIPERYLSSQSMMSASVNATESRDHFMFGWGRRICPGIDLSDIMMFNVMVGVLAATTIEPPLDSKSVPMYPDVQSYRCGGLVVAPGQSELRFVERPNRLI